jgi:hypothetical protein
MTEEITGDSIKVHRETIEYSSQITIRAYSHDHQLIAVSLAGHHQQEAKATERKTA